MLTICDKKIIISKGDTFDVTFKLYGYELIETDIVVFTIKDKLDSPNEILEKKMEKLTGDLIRVKISAEEMETLSEGTHYYDVLCHSGDVVLALCYPQQCVIKEVVHNGVQ